MTHTGQWTQRGKNAKTHATAWTERKRTERKREKRTHIV